MKDRRGLRSMPSVREAGGRTTEAQWRQKANRLSVVAILSFLAKEARIHRVRERKGYNKKCQKCILRKWWKTNFKKKI